MDVSVFGIGPRCVSIVDRIVSEYDENDVTAVGVTYRRGRNQKTNKEYDSIIESIPDNKLADFRDRDRPGVPSTQQQELIPSAATIQSRDIFVICIDLVRYTYYDNDRQQGLTDFYEEFTNTVGESSEIHVMPIMPPRNKLRYDRNRGLISVCSFLEGNADATLLVDLTHRPEESFRTAKSYTHDTFAWIGKAVGEIYSWAAQSEQNLSKVSDIANDDGTDGHGMMIGRASADLGSERKLLREHPTIDEDIGVLVEQALRGDGLSADVRTDAINHGMAIVRAPPAAVDNADVRSDLASTRRRTGVPDFELATNADPDSSDVQVTVLLPCSDATTHFTRFITATDGVIRDLPEGVYPSDITPEMDYSGADFSDVSIRKASLRDADFSEADLSSASMKHVNLTGADLSEADLVFTNFSGTILDTSDIRDVSARFGEFTRAELDDTNLSNADLTGADFSKAEITNADFSNADLTKADFSKAEITNADFSNADLSNADLTEADLIETDFSSADLTKTDLTKADLTASEFSEANLDHSIIVKADVTDADFSDANFLDVDLQYTTTSDGTFPERF